MLKGSFLGRKRFILAFGLEVTVQDRAAPFIWYLVEAGCGVVEQSCEPGSKERSQAQHSQNNQASEF